MQELISFLFKVEYNVSQVAEVVAKDAFDFAPMLFDLQRFIRWSLLPDEPRPAQGQREQRQQLTQALSICQVRGLQAKAVRLENAE